ncbi:MAG: choice-of-anchor D domain-containing protein [Salinibacter sp.]
MEGLTPGTEHFFAIKSDDTFGNTSDLSNVASATTDEAPAIAVDPEEVDQTLNVGDEGSDMFEVLNEGVGTLEYSLQPALGGSEISDPIGEPTAADDDYLEGNYDPATGKAPGDGEPVEGASTPRVLNADLEGTMYFGVNSGEDETNFVSFEGSNPEELDAVGSYPGSGFSNAGDFPRNDDSFVYELDNEGNLRTFDVESGDVEDLGDVGLTDVTGMSTDPTSGEIYVNTGTTLHTLDPDALETEEIGSFGVDLMIDIAVDDEGTMYGYSVSTNAFYEIDKETGEATEVGDIGFDANFGQGLTWDAENGVMIMAAFNNTSFQGELRTVNRETGDTELVGVIGEDTPGGTNQLGWVATPIQSTGEWLAADPTEGTIEAGNSDEIDLSFQTTFDEEGVIDLTGGLDYFADVEIESNDPGTPTETVPVTLTVEGNPAVSVSDDPLDFGDVFTGTSSTEMLTVINDSDDAILQVGSLELDGEGFTLEDDANFVLDPGESMDLPITFEPTESSTYDGTLSFASSAGDQEVELTGQGAPFVSIDPDELEQEIDLTTGDSTATQEFTVTNEFDESLPFIALVEALESEGDAIDLTPKLADEELRRWRQMNQMEPQSDSEVEPSYGPAPEGGADSKDARSAAARMVSGPEVLDEAGVTAYGNEVLAPEIVAFDVGLPGDFTVVDDGVDSYAGNFAFANNDEVYWIDNEDNTLKTYVLEDGSVEEVGELEPEGSDVTWTDMETDPTTGTTYVTTGDAAAGTNRLYELDENTATLELIGEFAAGDLVVALAIDEEGVGYAHDISNDQILEVDLENADAEALGSTGIDANYAQSMTWDAETGQLLMAALHDCGFIGCSSGTLRQVDRESGDTELIGSFPDGGGDELGWLATPGQGVSWLATNLEQGTLPAGASLTLEAEYDASDVVEGEYDAQISIVGEELEGQPSESVPVNLAVEAEPIAFVSKDSLGYGELFVNDTSSTQLVTLRNDGAANMNITDVAIDSDNFTFEGESEFTLEPGDAKIFDVAFTPQSEDEFSATMSITGEEVSGEVALTGEGIPAPELAVNPESFDKQAYLGQTQEETVEVSNPGGNPLEYDLSVIPSDPPAQDLLVDEDFSGSEFPPEDWFRAGANDGENWTTPEDSFCGIYVPDEYGDDATCFYWSPSTEGTQRLVTPALDTEGLSRVALMFNHAIDFFSDDSDAELRVETTGDGGENWTTVETFDAEDLPATEEMFAIDNEDVGSDEFHVAWTFEGDSFDINAWVLGSASVLAEGDWLAVDPQSGTIDPSESDTLDLTVDTNVPGIEEGTYESGVNFVTNDPLAESSDLPFTLSVIESLTVTPEHDGNGDVNPNEEFTLNMNVESLDDLEVFSYQMEMGFDTDRMQVEEVTTDGTLSEGLTLTSNIDNDEGTVSIAAADAGEESSSDGGSADDGDGPALFDIEGDGVLVSIEAQGQPDHGEMAMDMEEMVFNEGEPPATAENDTMEVVPLYGDVDLNLSVTSSDASEVLDYVVGETDLIEAQKTHGDVSGDGDVGAFDASLMLQRTVGSIGCFPVDPSCDEGSTALATQETSNESGQAEATFAWGDVKQSEQSSSEEGERLSLPLRLESADDPVQSVELSTELDPDKVSVEGVESQLPDGWQTTHSVADDGTLKIALAGTTPLDEEGKLATVTLRQDDPGAEMEMGGTVAVNEGTTQELESKSVVSVPDEFALEGTYPNPFSQSATLEMQLPKEADVTVEVYDVLGRQVKTAYDGTLQAGASRTVQINGSDLSTGTYFYRVSVEMGDDSRTESGRMTVVR